MTSDIIVAFCEKFACIYDRDLVLKFKTTWNRSLQDDEVILLEYGIASNNIESGQTGFICVFNVTGQTLQKI